MAKDLNMAMLFDVYGQLLTDKQRDAMDMYYNEDLSLAEIADETGISRQGVLANIKQGEGHLEKYESKLGTVSRFMKISGKIKEIENILSHTRFEGKDKVVKILEDISKEL